MVEEAGGNSIGETSDIVFVVGGVCSTKGLEGGINSVGGGLEIGVKGFGASQCLY